MIHSKGSKMGGKQKRAAKYKKWIEGQNLLKQCKESSSSHGLGDVTSDSMYFDGSGDHLSDYQPIPYQVQQEILRHRAKKTKKQKNSNWIKRKLDQFVTSIEEIPSWPVTIVVTLILFIACFFLIRSLVQMFAPSGAAGIDRGPLYSGLRMAVPRPLYTFIRVVDYIFSSPDLSFEGVYNIIYPPEEYSRYNQQYQKVHKTHS